MDFVLNAIFTLLKNHFCNDQNSTILKKKLEQLNAIKEDNESKKSAKLQPRKKLKKEIELWFRDVERINHEILNDLQNEAGPSYPRLRKILGPNIILQKIQEVEDLLLQAKSYDGLVVDDPQWIGQVLSTTNLVGEAPKYLMKEIWAYLMDDGVSKIGVWGMGGVGKTTIMKLIHNQLLQETEKFNAVMWITVSKELDIVKLQDGIARAMTKSPLGDDDVTRRAGMIYQMLSRKDKYVLILDDVWDKLSLEEVGIPEPTIGRKLVITTRSLDICHYLDCREIRVPTLLKQDALSLFIEKVGRDVWSDSVLSPTVEVVIEQCAGLPLAIVTVASSMKGKRDINEWKNAFIELERRVENVNNLNETILQQLKFSYDRLETERVKQCFLCCALYPEDFDITKANLIELWIAVGLVEELESMEEEKNRGHAILNKLVSNCLLENGGSCVKLHDLVRDMALDITTRGKPRFLVKAGMQLKEIPDLKEWAEDLDKVSLMVNWGMQIPPQMLPPKCRNLTTLLLSNCSIESIPECFFEQMHRLKVLDLSKNHFIKSLPNSISDLETLSALLLQGCKSLENMPSFSKLQALKRLNLEGTSLWNLPHGMERLVKLKYLNFSDTLITKIPDGILSKFSCLQHLVGHRELERRERFLRGDEIGGLRKLEIFKGKFCDVEELSNYAQALDGQTQGPHEYYIWVGAGLEFLAYDIKYKKCIELSNCQIYINGAKFPSDIQELDISWCSFEFSEEPLFLRFIPVPHDTFSALTYIDIGDCGKIKKLFSSDWVLKNLQNLEVLKVRTCVELEEIIASASELEEEGMDSSSTLNLALPKLKELSLMWLPKLKSICSAKGAMVCDSLQRVEIYSCAKLQRIPLYLPLLEEGRPSPPPSLQNLEELEIGSCAELEEIIASASKLEEEGMDSSSTLDLPLPKLRELTLGELPKLKSIYSAKGAMVCDSLQRVEIYDCSKLKRIPLYLPLLEEGRPSPPPSLQRIKINRTEWENMEWDHPYAKSVLEPFLSFI